MKVVAVLSMLHEPAGSPSAATRLFRGRPVLRWTLERLRRCRLDGTTVICWEDQRDLLREMDVECVGQRKPLPLMDAITAARRWAAGWRGGLLGTCWFDRGFLAAALLRICDLRGCDAVVIVDASAGLVDSTLIDALVERADGHRTRVKRLKTKRLRGGRANDFPDVDVHRRQHDLLDRSIRGR